MKRFFIVTLLLGFIHSIDAQANYYFPDKNEQWKQKPATDFKIDQTKIGAGVVGDSGVCDSLTIPIFQSVSQNR